MRNRVLFVCMLVFWLCGAGCQTPSKRPVAVAKPVEVPPSRILTLSQQQLVSLDWHTPKRPGPRVRAKTVVAGPAVEFDIYFPSNSPGNHSLNFVSSGEGGMGTLAGADIRGYETFALKLTLVSINGQSEPELKQKVVAGAVIGPTATHQLSTYEPVTLGLAASEKTVIAKTSGLPDRIYQIGFHVHMLNPQDWDPSGSTMRLRAEPVEDGQLGAAPATVSATPAAVPAYVTPEQLPVAEAISVTIMEDTPVEIGLTGSDPDSDPLVYSYSTVAGPSHGILSGTAPNLTYTPDLNFNGSDYFTFKVNVGTTYSFPSTVSITVTPVEDLPIANGESARTQENTPVSIALTGSDPDGDLLSYSVLRSPSHGSLSGTEPNLIYTPNANFYGSDSFSFKVNDGTTDSVPTIVSITVSQVNDPPTASGDNLTTSEDTSLSVALAGSDPDEDPLNYSVVTDPSHGSLTGTAPELTYTPNTNFNGSDSFTFKVNDGTTDSVPATVSITVSPVNDPPVANDDNAATQEDVPLVAVDVLANDTDVDNDTLTMTAVSQCTNASVTINPDRTLTYRPNANFHGSDSFTYTISDGKGQTDTASVNVTVNMINDSPVITSAPVITATAGALYRYDINAEDPDVGDTLTYSLTTKPAGMTIDSATGLIRWRPTSTQGHTIEAVVVEVVDSSSTPALDSQSFTITVKPAPRKRATLTVSDGYNQRNRKTLSEEGKTNIVQSSDDNWLETCFGSYISYDFSDVSIPADAVITSVAVYVEHFEEEQFTQGKLQWAVGTGWPTKPVVWASIAAPVYNGQSRKSVDSWHITSIADTREKVNSLQLQVKNNDNVANRKTLIDYIYVVVEF